MTDRTGLSGRYDLRLEYAPGFADRDPVAAAGPSLLVIDRVEKPSPD